MKNYIGCKIIKAKPMTYGEYKKLKYGDKANFESSLKDESEGYMVIYPNPGKPNHMSWSPKNVFEMAYREIVDYEIDLINDDIRL